MTTVTDYLEHCAAAAWSLRWLIAAIVALVALGLRLARA